MAERFSNYPYRDTQSNILFSSLGPLLQGYMENKRRERELSKQYQDQEIALRQANPNIGDEDAQRLSRVNRGSFAQILNSMQQQQAAKSGQMLAERLGQDPAQLEGLTAQDQNMFLRQQLDREGEERQVQRSMAREQRQYEKEIAREQRQEDRFQKRQLFERQVQELIAQGFSLKQARKLAGRDISGKIPKGLTVPLKRLASLRSDYINRKIDDATLEMATNNDPVQLAMIRGGATDPETEGAIAKLIGKEALQRAQRSSAYKKLPLILKDYKVKSLVHAMGKQLGRYYEKPRKPGSLEIEISKTQDRERKRQKQLALAAKKAKEKRDREIAVQIAWEDLGG